MTIKKYFIKTTRTLAAVFLLLLILAISYVLLGMFNANSSQHEDRVQSSPRSGTFVSAFDTKMFVQRIGNINAPAVVFVHGTGAWSEIWRTYMDQSVALGYQAIAIDLPPFGYSIPPASGIYNKGAQAKRILAALDSMGIQKATFVAHSIGSAPLMEALLSAPQRVAKLVLVCPALGLDGAQGDGTDTRMQKVLRQQWIAQSLSAAFLTNPSFTTTLVKSFVTEKDKITPEWIRVYQKPFSLSGSYQNIALWLPELASARGLWKSDDLESYKKIGFPVSLIWGDKDNVTPLAQGLHMHALISNSNLVVIPRSGHVPMIEEPGEFAKALENALRL
jgi:pimeloyl-ACP methyl ester carboxylesterase